jgi:hypothetical protein
VTDAQKIEPVLLAALAKQGIDAGNVELRRDYAPRSRGEGYSPYARTYQDALTKKHFAVVSGLPGCDAYGQSHELNWRDNNGVIESGNNIFHSLVDRNGLSIVALSDQPTGIKKNDLLDFHPQLFIGGVEIKPVLVTPEIRNDPLNGNYAYNTLEWDYGVCKRRIRLIEGRLLGSWVFTVLPKSDITIKYNQAGKFRLRLNFAKDEDTEFIPEAYFEQAEEWPVTISDSATFYPDADPETSSVDGYLTASHGAGSGVDWSNLIAEGGSASYDTSETGRAVYIYSDSVENKWRLCGRGAFLFDTSTLDDEAIISSASLFLRGSDKADNLSVAPNVNIYSVSPVYNNDLITGDFDSFGSTPFCDTPITYAGWSTSNYNAFGLNSIGIAAISKTGVSKFGTRNADYDVSGTPPTWHSSAYSRLETYMAEQGEGYQPKLVVTYATGVTEKSAEETGAGTEAKISGNPIVVTGGAETGAGVESLGSRDLGNIETGVGAESLGSRELGRAEAGSGLDIASLLAALGGNETGAGAEAALKIGAYFSGDSGRGAELSGMLKDALAGDAGLGADGLKSMIKTAGTATDMRLYEGAGQSGPPSRQVKMPSKGVNL